MVIYPAILMNICCYALRQIEPNHGAVKIAQTGKVKMYLPANRVTGHTRNHTNILLCVIYEGLICCGQAKK